MDAENVPDVVLRHILESDRPITGLPVLRAMARELLALRPALAAAQRERDDFKTKYEFMVLKACDEKLPAYREQAMNLLAAIERAEAAEDEKSV